MVWDLRDHDEFRCNFAVRQFDDNYLHACLPLRRRSFSLDYQKEFEQSRQNLESAA
jgi:hypothetical protein